MKKDSCGLYIGSFNPMTVGHEDVLDQAADTRLFQKILVCRGSNPAKNNKEYMSMDVLRSVVQAREEQFDDMAFDAMEYTGMTHHFWRKMHDQHPEFDYTLIRGLRSIDDFESERFYIQTVIQMAKYPIPVVYFLCQPQFSNVSSTMVRNLIDNDQYDYAEQFIAPYDPELWRP